MLNCRLVDVPPNAKLAVMHFCPLVSTNTKIKFVDKLEFNYDTLMLIILNV